MKILEGTATREELINTHDKLIECLNEAYFFVCNCLENASDETAQQYDDMGTALVEMKWIVKNLKRQLL